VEGRGWSYSAPGGETRIAGTASAGDAATGDTERVDRLGEKKDVNLEEVLENDEERPWGTVDVDLPEVERVWADADDLDALLRTIPSFLKGCVSDPKAKPFFCSQARERERSRNWRSDSDFLFRFKRLKGSEDRRNSFLVGLPCSVCGMRGSSVALMELKKRTSSLKKG
jgi:hypothetical protein